MAGTLAHDLYKWPADAYRRDQDEFFLEYRRQKDVEGDLIGLKEDAPGGVFLVDGQVTHDKSAQGVEVDLIDGNVTVEIFPRLEDDEAFELDGQKDVLDVEIKGIGQDKDRQDGIDCFTRPVHGIYYNQAADGLQSKVVCCTLIRILV